MSSLPLQPPFEPGQWVMPSEVPVFPCASGSADAIHQFVPCCVKECRLSTDGSNVWFVVFHGREIKPTDGATALFPASYFNLVEGAYFPGLIDERGRVFNPSPYDMPMEPLKLGAFALRLLEALLDTRMVPVSYFNHPEEFYAFRNRLMHLRSQLDTAENIQYQDRLRSQ